MIVFRLGTASPAGDGGQRKMKNKHCFFLYFLHPARVDLLSELIKVKNIPIRAEMNTANQTVQKLVQLRLVRSFRNSINVLMPL